MSGSNVIEWRQEWLYYNLNLPEVVVVFAKVNTAFVFFKKMKYSQCTILNILQGYNIVTPNS